VKLPCQSAVQLYGVSWLCRYMVSVGYEGIWCQLVMQVYGVGYAGIWCQLVMKVYGVSRLCKYMVSVGYEGIWCQ